MNSESANELKSKADYKDERSFEDSVSVVVIAWGTFARELPSRWQWMQCNLDGIIVGAVGTAALLAVAGIFALVNRKRSAVI